MQILNHKANIKISPGTPPVAIDDPRSKLCHRQESILSPHTRDLVFVDRSRHLLKFLRHHDLTDNKRDLAA